MTLLSQFSNAFGGGLWFIPLTLLLASAWTYFGRYKLGYKTNAGQKGTLVYAGLEALAAIVCTIIMWNAR